MSTVAAAYVKSQLRTKKSASALLLLLLLLPVHISEVGRVGGGFRGGGRGSNPASVSSSTKRDRAGESSKLR